jgi:Zn-dependent protease with chaperone function
LVLILVVACLLPRSSEAQQPSARVQAEQQAYDAKLLAELEGLEPDVSDIWRQGNDARDAGDFEAAMDSYAVVLEQQPKWDHALRRRCTTMLAQDKLSLALGDCRAAYEQNPRPENAVALAQALSVPSALRDSRRARELARAALRSTKDDFVTAFGVCQVALGLEDSELLGDCSTRMRELDDGAWEAQLFTALHHAQLGSVGKAKRALERAHEFGLDDDVYDQVLAMIEGSESPWSYYGKRVGLPLLAWVGLALGLIAAGVGLSRLTLAEAEGALSNSKVSARASDSRLHRAYAAVMWLCCAYYYVSVPLILLLMVGLGAVIIGALIYIGHIPIKLLILVVVLVFGTVFAVLKSFFTRPKQGPPGELLNLAEAPKLRAVLDEVASKVGTRPVECVYLTPGADIAVFERGGLWAKLRGKGERSLLLGVAVLDGLDTQALQAILAHEYGHFSNEDTAGGNFALGVRRSVLQSAVGLAEAGVAGWHNPAWLFLYSFNKLFLRISQGASRLQEVLADRWSARTYGAAAFERGLRHAIAAELRFDVHAQATLHEVLEARHGLRNLYSYSPSKLPEQAERIPELVEEVINAEPSPYDSHPRPTDRFRWVRALDEGDDGSSNQASAPAWSLFEDRSRIEEWMTDVIRNNVAAQTGMVIPVEENERVRRKRMLDG